MKEKNKTSKKVDFRKIEIENISGEKDVIDLSKLIGNAIWNDAKSLEVSELGRNIWKNGEVEIDDEQMKILENCIPQLFPTYILKTGILNALK